jgi:Spy/CpxP family protein refolding chaperone
MKQRIIVGTLATLIVSGWMFCATTGAAQTAAGAPSNAASGIGGRVLQHRLSRLADVLGLTSSQREQMKTLWNTEWGNIVPLRQELKDNRKQLFSLATAGTFDEQAVRAIAEKQANIRTELVVAQARLASEVNAVLTAEQRDRAKKLYALVTEGRPWRRF